MGCAKMPLLIPLILLVAIAVWVFLSRWFDDIGNIIEKIVERIKGNEQENK